MCVKKLPSYVQIKLSTLCVNNFTRAVEELVCNAIDAKASSIAVRVHIKEGFIQVIDNGAGMNKFNLKCIGENYTTSKHRETAINSVSEYHGFRGQALASLIQVSYRVDITSRYNSSDETWSKTFICGKANKVTKANNPRPSKGTTVELKGFLHNLKIRKKSIDELTELNKLKSFMEKLSLVYHNLSLSLRDNSRNEITFKVHKNRDIYQSLFSLCGIEKQHLQELQVEKNNYKVKAYISNKDNIMYHWIYLNKKFVTNGRLKKIVNDRLKKYSYNTKINKLKTKKYQEEEVLCDKTSSSYFIFITCPNKEYDFSNTPKQSLLEFKNWETVTKLLEKLIQFYFGQINLKEKNECKSLREASIKNNTKDQVKRIVKKVFGGISKKPKISHVQNEIRGKNVKRIQKKNINTLITKDERDQPRKSVIISKPHNTVKVNSKFEHKDQKLIKQKCKTITKSKQSDIATARNEKKCNDRIIRKFEEDCFSVKKRCEALAGKVNIFTSKPSTGEKNVMVNHTVQYNNIIKDNREYTFKRQVEEFTIETTNFKNGHDYVNLRSSNENHHENVGVGFTQTLTFDAAANHINSTNANFPKYQHIDLSGIYAVPYFSHQRMQTLTFDSHENNNNNDVHQYRLNDVRNFVSANSVNNFDLPIRTHQRVNLCQVSRLQQKRYSLYKTVIESSYAINTFESNKENNVIDTYQLVNAVDKDVINVDIPTLNLNKRAELQTENSYCTESENQSIQESNDEMIYSNYFGEVNERCLTSRTDKVIIKDTDKGRQKIASDTYTLFSPSLSLAINDLLEINNLGYSSIEPHNELNDPRNSDYSLIFISEQQPILYNGNFREIITPISYEKSASDDMMKASSNNDEVKSSAHVTIANDNLVNDILVYQLENLKLTSDGTEFNIGLTYDRIANYFETVNENNATGFQFNSRHRFVPKGMSPICVNNMVDLSKNICNEDLYAKEIYDDFKNNVQTNTNIFEPNIQNMKELASKDIIKFKNKTKQDETPLIFDCQSLEQAKVLGQVDHKFIATIMQGKCYFSKQSAVFLSLFDQHAIHERIRLENILTDYVLDDQWKSIQIDNVYLNLTHEELLYIGNYSEKFKKFGLRWTLINDKELSLNGIPEAILGKNLRSVEKIIIAVKALIRELMDSIRSQKGAIPVYPKSIMNLVFSEACRYAIKFGDKLTNEVCVRYIRELSSCKVPFQCAHGRPVMAILLELETKIPEYSINIEKIAQFKKENEN